MRDHTSFQWTQERCEQLTSLWANGLSAKECVLELGGGLSRSSVIGKVHRLNLPQREQDKRSPNGTRAPRKPHERRYVRKTINGCASFERAPLQPAQAPHIVDHDIPLEQRKSLMELTGKTCKFPVGNPDEATFFFCGAEPAGASPYCASHSARCFDRSYRARRPFIPMRAGVAA